MGKQTYEYILVANPSVQLSLSQSEGNGEVSSQYDYSRSDWLEQADRPKPLMAALSWSRLDWALWLTPTYHQDPTLITYQLWHGLGESACLYAGGGEALGVICM